MSKFRLISMAFASLLIVAGFVYLYASVSVAVSLAICALSILGMGISSALEVRESGGHGAIAYLTAICFMLLGAAVAAVCIYVLIK